MQRLVRRVERIVPTTRDLAEYAIRPTPLFPVTGAKFYAGTGAARTIGTGLNVKAIRKAPIPMIQEPI
jgi:hypothetical protein